MQFMIKVTKDTDQPGWYQLTAIPNEDPSFHEKAKHEMSAPETSTGLEIQEWCYTALGIKGWHLSSHETEGLNLTLDADMVNHPHLESLLGFLHWFNRP